MNFEKFTERSRGFLQSAQGLALREGQQRLTPEHLLKVLLDDAEGLSAGLITRAGGRPDDALAKTEEVLAKLPKVSGSGAGQLYLTPALASMTEFAPGWIATIWLRNAFWLTLVAGGLHWWLYLRRGQGSEYKFHERWLATSWRLGPSESSS